MEYSNTYLHNLAQNFAKPIPHLIHDGRINALTSVRLGLRAKSALEILVSKMNEKALSRKRKSLDTLKSILDNRSISHLTPDKNSAVTISILQQHYAASIVYEKGKGLFINLAVINIHGAGIAVNSRNLHLSAAEEDIADLIEAYEHFLSMGEEAIRKGENEISQKKIISEISQPSLRFTINDFMKTKGIQNYNLSINDYGRNTLEVQIIDNYWMSNDSITIDNIDRILSLVPYLISRPDRIEADGLGFKKIEKW